jgi:hypothetical protein
MRWQVNHLDTIMALRAGAVQERSGWPGFFWECTAISISSFHELVRCRAVPAANWAGTQLTNRSPEENEFSQHDSVWPLVLAGL